MMMKVTIVMKIGKTLISYVKLDHNNYGTSIHVQCTCSTA